MKIEVDDDILWTIGEAVVGVAVVVIGLFWLHVNRRICSIDGRCALITGAGSGLGRQLALALARKHASRLVLLDVRKNLLDETVKEVQAISSGVEVACYVCDVSDEDDVRAVAESEIKKGKPATIIIQNAGIVYGRPVHELKVDDFRRALQVNCLAHFIVMKYFLLPIVDSTTNATGPTPVLVSISSLMGLMGAARLTEYAASKHGVCGLHESLRLELSARCPNRCPALLLVCPYAIDTGMFDGIYEGSRWNRFIRWVFPLLKANEVAERIALGIERGEQHLILPERIRPLVALIQLFPVVLYDLVLGIMGATHGMDEFRGRGVEWNR